MSIMRCVIVIYSLLWVSFGNAKEWKTVNINNTKGLNNSAVNILFQDRTGVLWIGTWDGLNRYDGCQISHVKAVPNNSTTLSHPVVRDIHEDVHDNVLWVVTDWGINRMSRLDRSCRQYYLDSPHNVKRTEKSFMAAADDKGNVVAYYNGGNLHIYNNVADKFVPIATDLPKSVHLKAMAFDSNGFLMATDSDRLYMMKMTDGALRTIRRYPLPQNVSAMTFDNYSRLWVQTGNRLLYVNNGRFVEAGMEIDGRLTCVSFSKKGCIVGTNNGYYAYQSGHLVARQLENIYVTSILHGTQDIIWIGTDGKGVYQYYQDESFAKSYEIGDKNLPVRAICLFGNNMLIGTKGEGLLVFDVNENRPIQHINTINVGNGRAYNAVFSLCPSRDGRIWVGADVDGLGYYKDGQLLRMDYTRAADAAVTSSIYSIVEVNDSTLYLGCSGSGLVKVSRRGNLITHVKQYGKNVGAGTYGNIVYSVITDGHYIWAGTRGGGLMRLDTHTEQLVTYSNDPTNPRSLWSNDIISLYKDSRGQLWIGMSQGLDMMCDDNGQAVFLHYNNSGLADLNIHSIREDYQGNIWVSTSYGVSKITPKGETFNFTYRDGLQGNEFSDGAGLSYKKGQALLFGGTNGITAIRPALLNDGQFMPKLILSGIKIDNTPVALSNEYAFDNETMSYLFSFSIMDYISNDRCEISYRLERHSLLGGKEHEWINIGAEKDILLNQLPPGEYTLYVRQSNSAHIWAQQPLVISFHVRYPWWLRWWSISLYVIVITAVIVYYYREKKRKEMQRHEREMERQAAQFQQDTHHAKLRFFANVSSQFSSHITHIYNAIDKINATRPEDNVAENVKYILGNVKDMDRQIQRLSEIQSAGIDDSDVTANVVKITEAVKYSLDDYTQKIIANRINLDIKDDDIMVVTDKMLFLKAIHNILSYIFRTIDEKGAFAVGWKMKNNQAVIDFDYSATAPDNDQLEIIFNQFKALDIYERRLVQGEDDKNFRLTIGNELAKRLGGGITVAAHGEGMTRISLTVTSMPKTLIKTSKEDEKTSGIEKIISSGMKRILVVMDDGDMTSLVRSILEKSFIIDVVEEQYIAQGNELENTYEMVIYEPAHVSDLSFISHVKNNERTRFMPIVAICSSSDKETGARMLRLGANSILEKPFQSDYLKAIVEREMMSSDQMRDYSDSTLSYMRRFNTKDMTKEDTEFLYKLTATVSQHYADEDYNPSSLAQDMAMSRTQLYRKFKLVSDLSPTDFILQYRMYKAVKALRNTDKSISEIISQCGFRNRAFFYREFARQYNCSPKEYRNSSV